MELLENISSLLNKQITRERYAEASYLAIAT